MADSRSGMAAFLLRRSGGARMDWTDWLSYGYLLVGVLVMFGPVAWVALSSIKSPGNITEFPPTILPYDYQTIVVPGHDKPLQLVDVKLPDGTVKRLAQVARIGLAGQHARSGPSGGAAHLGADGRRDAGAPRGGELVETTPTCSPAGPACTCRPMRSTASSSRRWRR